MAPPAPHHRPAPRRRAFRALWVLWGITLTIAGLCCLLAAQSAVAGSLQVAPISVELSHDERAEALWLSNTGDLPIRAQVRVMKWSQAAGTEQLEPSRELMPSPPIVEIGPGERQLVRIVRPDPTAPGQEQAFRLIVDELPDAQQTPDAGLQFLLQYSVPVFVLAPGAVPQDAPGPRPPTEVSQVSASVDGGGADARLAVVNRGTRRVRLSQLSYLDAAGAETMLVPGLVGYVLAGQRMQWPLSLPAGGLRGGNLKVRFNDDQQPQLLPLASNP